MSSCIISHAIPALQRWPVRIIVSPTISIAQMTKTPQSGPITANIAIWGVATSGTFIFVDFLTLRRVWYINTYVLLINTSSLSTPLPRPFMEIKV